MAHYILEKLIVGSYGCNCYLVGSKNTNEIYIIDPGAEEDLIIKTIDDLNAHPIGIILTHAHPDHTGAYKFLKNYFDIPLLYNKHAFQHIIFKKADQWLKEGDVLRNKDFKLTVLETAGHSPGGISLYSNDIRTFRGNNYDGIIFTGDLIFRRSIGRSNLLGGDQELLFSNIKNKIIYNPLLSENFLILAGHLGITTIGEEKTLNPFGKFFLTEQDWKKNKYYNKDLKRIFNTAIEDRI